MSALDDLLTRKYIGRDAAPVSDDTNASMESQKDCADALSGGVESMEEACPDADSEGVESTPLIAKLAAESLEDLAEAATEAGRDLQETTDETAGQNEAAEAHSATPDLGFGQIDTLSANLTLETPGFASVDQYLELAAQTESAAELSNILPEFSESGGPSKTEQDSGGEVPDTSDAEEVELASDVEIENANSIVDEVLSGGANDLLEDGDDEMGDQLDSTPDEGMLLPIHDARQEEASPRATAENVPFKPEWEVDRFSWPGICGVVEDRIERELESTVESIVESCREHESNVVLLTGASRGVGSTTIALCLAREAARQGLRVALVDLDHANPDLMDQLGVAFDSGVEHVDRRGVTPAGICVHAIDEGVSLIPAAEEFAPELAAYDATRQLFATVARNHDLVLVNTSRETAGMLIESGDVDCRQILVTHAELESSAVFQNQSGSNAMTLGTITNFAA